MQVIEDKKKYSVDFSLKAAWLAVSKMYNTLGASYDISHSTGFVLLNIDKEQGTPATKIAPLMGMEARSLTRMLKTMEEKKMIYRCQDDGDKRKVIIMLTEEGKLKRELARKTVKTFHHLVEERVAPEKLKVFFEVIQEIHRLIEDPEGLMAQKVYENTRDLLAPALETSKA